MNERERNIAAIREHLVYIDALKSHDRSKVAAAVKTHLAGGRAGSRRLFGAIDFGNRTIDGDTSYARQDSQTGGDSRHGVPARTSALHPLRDPKSRSAMSA
jgi:hypothetical protein